MKITERNQKKEVINNLPNFSKFNCIVNYEKAPKKERAVKESSDTVFVFWSRAKRYGIRLSLDEFLNTHDLIIDTEEEIDKKWHKRINKAIKYLNESGLWPDIKNFFENLSKMSYSDKKAIEEIYWNHWHVPNEDTQKAYQPYVEKYPFAFISHEDGSVNVCTKYIFEESECKLKSMYFGKHENTFVKEKFAEALKNKQSYSTGIIKVNYDVSLEYNAKLQKAWYSEEYVGCGNGHYYIALNANTALFCEDD